MGYEVEPKKIEEILIKVGLSETFDKRGGLNTLLGDGGVAISGGQAQRIAIARALYRDSEIIIMDEPTSALDAVTSEKLMKNIYELTQEKTLIVVTHNPKILNQCDYIYKFIDGRLTMVNPQ